MRRLGIGHRGTVGLRGSGMEMFPVKDAANHERKGNGGEDEATELAFPKRIKTMDVHSD